MSEDQALLLEEVGVKQKQSFLFGSLYGFVEIDYPLNYSQVSDDSKN